MKEILFKGKRADNGEWVEGDYITIYDERRHKAIQASGIETPRRIYEVIPETICQYTGLTDKNGKKIFEGDILKLEDYHGHRVVRVFYGESCGCWFYGGDRFSDEYIFNGQFKEVIGNIFDNPELLTED